MAEPAAWPRCELVLGGQRSGKSARAESLAAQWLAQAPGRKAVLIATARADDGEMKERIHRHRQDRAQRLPTLQTVEEPLALALAIQQHSNLHSLVWVDCLTLWLTNLTIPAQGQGAAAVADPSLPIDLLDRCLASVPGPVVLVSNEIGLGVVPMAALSRRFVDDLGRLNQRMAKRCERVVLMVAGCPLALKGAA